MKLRIEQQTKKENKKKNVKLFISSQLWKWTQETGEFA
jgi:hypothetical protein